MSCFAVIKYLVSDIFKLLIVLFVFCLPLFVYFDSTNGLREHCSDGIYQNLDLEQWSSSSLNWLVILHAPNAYLTTNWQNKSRSLGTWTFPSSLRWSLNPIRAHCKQILFCNLKKCFALFAAELRTSCQQKMQTSSWNQLYCCPHIFSLHLSGPSLLFCSLGKSLLYSCYVWLNMRIVFNRAFKLWL